MEWMLQVLDELDDVVGAVRLCCVGLGAEIGLAAAGCLGIAAIGACVAAGAQITLILSAAIVLSVAAALKIRGVQLESGR